MPAETRTVADFYRRELTARGWKENVDAATATPGQTQLAFTNPTGGISVNLTRAGTDVRVNLVLRDTEKAKSAGILPPPHRARLVLGNASDKAAVIVINDKQYKLAAGVGAKDPRDGTSLNVLPGKYHLTLKVPGQPDGTEELKVNLDETWGVIVLPTGGHFADQLY